jgi:Fe2+ transport system protein FeoA
VLKLISSRKWNETCPAGPPIPEEHRCAALHCESVSLTQLSAGQGARVTCLDAAHTNVAAKLASMGILPGSQIRLVRRSPAFVFRIDYAEFAVDRELAAVIRVAPEA